MIMFLDKLEIGEACIHDHGCIRGNKNSRCKERTCQIVSVDVATTTTEPGNLEAAAKPTTTAAPGNPAVTAKPMTTAAPGNPAVTAKPKTTAAPGNLATTTKPTTTCTLPKGKCLCH